MNTRSLIAGFLVALMAFVPFAQGATTTSEVIVTQVITGNDNVAPSVPQNLVATTISSDQIDLSWDASSDNVGVVGYNIFRDGFAIATTSGTTYQDGGLAPATLYAYTVRAFDAAGNYSAHSATATAMTDAVVVPPATGGVSTGTKLEDPTIANVVVVAGETDARISWRTDRPTRATLAWGRTSSYEMGSVAFDLFATAHGTQITDLMPDTLYRFVITVVDAHGFTSTREMQFRTKALPDVVPPPNVSDLKGVGENEDDVRLTWENPGGDFDHVVVVRGDGAYPQNPTDGLLIYEGAGESFLDRDALKEEDRSFYTVFAYDRSGNHSSGAIVLVVREGVVLPPPEESPYAQPIDFSDLRFIQDGVVIPFVGAEVKLDATRPFTVELPYERVPEHLKTIMITLKDSEDQIFSFLLRADETANAYRAAIDALGQNGAFPLALQILDYRERTISTTSGTLVAAGMVAREATVGIAGLLARFFAGENALRFSILLMLILLAIAALVAAKRKSERRHKQQYAAL